MTMLNDDDLERYARQVIMPEIDEQGQQRLAAAKVLVIGAGGLGAPVILYLAAAGIGKITILDDDKVALTDLNRQIIYMMQDIGTSKARQAANAITRLNPVITATPIEARLTADNAETLIRAHDIIVDCSDNPETRQLLGTSCHHMQRPLVFGGAVQLEGQLSVFQSNIDGYTDTPCFHCVFPAMPNTQQAPRCSQVGILGPVTGVIGAMQALETIKLCLGLGTSLTGKLFLFDGRDMRTMEIATTKNPDCPCCGVPASSGHRP